MRLDEKKQYELYSSYDQLVVGTFDSRGEANAERNISERDGDFSLRIRTIIVKDDK